MIKSIDKVPFLIGKYIYNIWEIILNIVASLFKIVSSFFMQKYKKL